MLKSHQNSIQTKCSALFAILGLFAAVWLASSLYGSRIGKNALVEMDLAAAALRQQMQADMDHDAIRGAVMMLIVADSQPSLDKAQIAEDLKGYVAEFRDLIGKTQTYRGSAAVRKASMDLNDQLELYLSSAEALARQSMANQPLSTTQLDQFTASFSALETGMEKVSDQVDRHLDEAHAEASEASLINLILTIACFAMIAAIILVVWRDFRKRLLQPVIALRDSLLQLRDENFEETVQHTRRPDEIGDLARATCDLSTMLQSAASARAEQADVIVESIGTALTELASGNLAARVDSNLVSPFDRLKTDFNRAISQLAQTLGTVRDATEQMQATSHEISQAVDDLSSRNEQQAANLEEIALSITDVTIKVVGSAESLSSVQAVVHEVNDEVSQGDAVIRSAVTAMDSIENSSREIGNIISVIDGIAFQTNLLALNAGVEAARAGEAGKGFAVVASEVRALAQRSTDAASAIKELISNSTDKVESGVLLVREAGTSLQSITLRMGEISSVIETACEGASQQAVTLREVDTRSKALERITQSNAALAEEVSASTRQIVDVTQRAKDELSIFTLGSGNFSPSLAAGWSLEQAA